MSTGQTNRVTEPVGYLGAPVVTGEAVRVEIRQAGIASRILAVLLDVAIQFGVLILISLLAAAFAVHANSGTAQAVVITLTVLLVLGYPVGFESLTRGRTPGKMALGIRVVRDDGGPIRFRHALVRGLVGVVIERPGFSVGSIGLIAMLLSRRGKRLGDMAAGTVVVQERVPIHEVAPPPMPPGLEAWASGLDLTGITDEVALRAREFLGRAPRLDAWAREDFGGRIVTDFVARTAAPVPPGVPGWAYLAAILAERRRREMARLTPPPVATASPPAQPPPVVHASPPPDPPPPDSPLADGPFSAPR